jgi:protein-S-isoprenylcysteine O-methyltransferase Ste14
MPRRLVASVLELMVANVAVLSVVADRGWFVRQPAGQALLVTTNILWLVVVVGSVYVPKGRVRVSGKATYYYLWMAPMLALLVACAADSGRRGAGPPAASPFPGLVLTAVGFLVSLVAWLDIRHYVSPRFQVVEDHRVVDRGLYRHVRHPIYLSFFLIAMGIVLLTWSLAGLVVFALLVVPIWTHVIRAEERFLLEHLGPAYGEYCRRTKRLVPFVY